MQNNETNTKQALSDYSHFDYKKEFWENTNRDYEDQCEKSTIQRLLNVIPGKKERIVDLGCGFGRLFPIYQNKAKKKILLDYAENLLLQAQENPDINGDVEYKQGNFYNLPLDSNSIDIALTIRTLHHIQECQSFFKEVSRILKEKGYFIMEIPNKRNILTIIRFILGKSHFNPFSKKPYEHAETFINYHPKYVIDILKKEGFRVIKTKNTNFCRLPLLKKYIPTQRLLQVDWLCQKLFSKLNLSPSIILLVQKKN